MHFKPHLLFAVLDALTSPTIAGPPSIKFCDHKGSDACITEKIEMAVCQTLPDSNNKGDGGSTFEFIDVPSDVQCAFQNDGGGCNDKVWEMATGGGRFPTYWWRGKYYYRHYVCNHSATIGPEYTGLPP